MKLLAISAKFGPFRMDKDPSGESPVEALELELRHGEIVFDQQGHPLLTVAQFGSRHITNPPGPANCGYFVATDSEIERLKSAGYALPDWRELKLREIVDLYHPGEKNLSRLVAVALTDA